MPKLIVCPFDPGKLNPGHNNTILAHGGFPAHPELKFGSAWGCLKPGMKQEPLMEPHTAKAYIAVRGALRIVADGETHEVRAGQAVFFPAGTDHTVEQIGDEDYVGFAFWWEV
jgi:mannose-6-phosphate isomerase-like protein (cupin superfamily)